jgi:hypothetical protein
MQYFMTAKKTVCMMLVNLFVFVICPVYDIIHEIVMVANIYETNLYNV